MDDDDVLFGRYAKKYVTVSYHRVNVSIHT